MRRIALTFLIFFFSGMILEAQESSQQFEGFNLVGYKEDGTKAWDVNGDTADILGNIVQLTNVVANAYGAEPMNLTAKTGTIDKESGHMHLEQDVVITSETGAQMKTDTLDWERSKDLVTTDDQVTITDDKMNLVGTGAIAHPNLQTAQINEDVTAKITSDLEKASQRMTITCDGPLEMDQGKQFAVFNNNVVATQEGRTLTADRMEVYFDTQSNKIKEMVCIGNVTITQGENKSVSEKAVFKPDEQKMILSGKPKLILFTEGENGIASFGN